MGTLIPVIGLVQVGGQIMADRYTYLPSIGVSVMLAWGIPLFFKHEDARKKILFPVAISLLIIISILTWEQCGYWKNSDNLFNHALRLTKNNYIAHNNLGLSLLAEGKNKDAIEHFNKAIYLYKEHAAEFYNNRGLACANLGQYQLSIKDYNEVIRLKTDDYIFYSNRGVAYLQKGDNTLGYRDAQKACALGNCKTLKSAKGIGLCR